MARVKYNFAYTGTSIMIAAINETFSLEETVRIIRETCDPGDVAEVLLLLSKTKSTPGCIATAEKLVAGGGLFPISIVWQSLPFAGGAYRDGIAAARGSHVLMMSADLETDPSLVRGMLEASRENPDAIVTMSRWIRGGGFTGYSKVKQVCNRIFQRCFSLIYLTGLSDLTYAFRNFPTDLMRRIDWKELRHPFFLETAVAPLRLRVRFVELPAHWKPRLEAGSQNSFFANFRYFKTAFRVRFTPWNKLLLKQTVTSVDVCKKEGK